MRRLILMRHAKSDWNHPGLGDHERPLNRRGTAAAKALGDWLRDNGYIPEEVLCSSAERTGQTLLGLALDGGTPVKFSRALYLAEAGDMLNVLRQATGNVVLMIGHNPGICEMAHRLVGDPPEHIRFEDYPTGATLVVDFDTDWPDVTTGDVTAFVIPRELKDGSA
ncbi:SixA phosphatase family protein [Roseobacter ponti]|uniref:Histidine phosphatase family protein n=1 Tax=Roseobacter ponti TaxID=1891787 RepID=A0A858SRD0_9RHOB|nr:histidine phosphatase family protein [Roseobacter ponti]QJF50233.1 histidine phosphatase family protein [Roseobacter ponti]